MTFTKEEQEVLSTTVLAKNLELSDGIFDKAQEDRPTEDDLDSDDSDSDSEPIEPRGLEEGKRGSNKNPTRGVMGTFARSKGTFAGPKKLTQTASGVPKGCTRTSKGTQADPKVVKK